MKNKASSIKLTITIPGEIYERIEKQRGDVSRSRFFLRLIEKGLVKKSDA